MTVISTKEMLEKELTDLKKELDIHVKYKVETLDKLEQIDVLLESLNDDNLELKAKNTRLIETIELVEENKKSTIKNYSEQLSTLRNDNLSLSNYINDNKDELSSTDKLQQEVNNLEHALNVKENEAESYTNQITMYERVLTAFGYDVEQINTIFQQGYLYGSGEKLSVGRKIDCEEDDNDYLFEEDE